MAELWEYPELPEIPDLPWARPFFGPRCKAVKERTLFGHWGRCELKANHEPLDHALERGWDIPRWSTKWTDGKESD